MKLILTFTLVTLALGQDATENDKLVVDTHYGKVQGSTGTSREGRMYYQFKGINYAKAPERFQAPEIPDNWEGVKDATNYGHKCPQYDPKTKEFYGQEDCLTLNVFSPRLPVQGNHTVFLPVVVLLHPGAHFTGSGEMFGPKYLMDEDVVVVTLNSRLGPFGYLNTGDMHAQGNMGLKDQSLALAFVQKNIEAFGGDKGRVTLMGFSAGAAETLVHILNPLSKGLFQGASVHSGSPLSPCSMVREPIKQAKKLGQQLGCPIDKSESLIKCLKEVKDPLDILKNMTMPIHDIDNQNFEEIAVFGPSVEKVLEGQTEADVVMADTPYKLIMEGKVINKVPIIIGGTEKDGFNPLTAHILNKTENLEKLEEKWTELVPLLLNFKSTATDAAAVAKKIKDFYVEEGKKLDGETLVKIMTDRYYAVPTRFAAKMYTKHAPVYPYVFRHTPEHSLLDVEGFKDLIKGPGHLADMPYFFNVSSLVPLPEITKDSTPEEYALSKGMVQLWSSFIENGKPTKTWGEGKEWKKLESVEKPSWYHIDVQPETMEEPDFIMKRMNFWSELFKNELIAETQTPATETF